MRADVAEHSPIAGPGRLRAALPPGEPIACGTFGATFQGPDAGRVPPVLLLSPFGYEELCSRTFFATLADDLASRGIASLRFDFPGTADALDVASDRLEDWRTAAGMAARCLRERTGQTTIAVVGQGLGAALALEWAADLGPVGAMVLLEPPPSGRAYLRGLKAWGALLATAIGIEPDPADAAGLSVAGMALPADRAAAVRTLDPTRTASAPAPAVLLLARPGSAPALKKLVRHLQSHAVALTEAAFPGYDGLLTDPTAAVVPADTIAQVTAWLGRQAAAAAPHPGRAAEWPADLAGDGFLERAVRFGPDGRLAGVLCRPAAGPRPHRAVVLANAGRDYHIGWGRSSVRQARALARAGVASLRFDVSGVGDSRSDGAGGEILYSTRQCDDLRAAIDLMARDGYPSIGLAGRCSGAWAAFTVAAEDPRVESLALVNIGYFLWDPGKILADVIRFSQRSVGDLGATFLKRAGLRRLLRGQLDVRGAGRFLVRQANLRIVRRHAALLGRLTPESRRYHDLHRLFGRLAERRVRIRLIYAQGDSSLGELRSFMGPRLHRLSRYPDVTVCEIAGADHNLTHRAAGDRVTSELVGLFGAGSPRSAQEARRASVTARPLGKVVEI